MEPTWSPVLSVGWGGALGRASGAGTSLWLSPLGAVASPPSASLRPSNGKASRRLWVIPGRAEAQRAPGDAYGKGALQEFWPLAPSTRGHPPPCSGLAGICVRLEFLRNKPCNSSSAQEPAIAPYGSRPQQTLGGHLMLGKKRLQVPGPSAAGSAVQLQTLPVFYSAEGG